MSDLTIRQATKNDISLVATFLSKAALVHRHLDWRPMLDWIEFEPFLLLFSQEQLCSVLSCAPDPEGIAWIHIFAADHYSTSAEYFSALFTTATNHGALSNHTFCTVGLYEWFNELVDKFGFVKTQDIVVLTRESKTKLEFQREEQVLTRPLELEDLDEVARVDTHAFEPIWVLSREMLELAFRQSEHAAVAELDGKIVGYEISTANHFAAHLARLAVDPTIARKHIGLELVRYMLDYYARRGIQNITVNTQSNNVASLSLYKKLGFIETDETFPVFTFHDR